MHVHQFSNMTRFDQRSAQCSFQKQPVWGQKPELYLLLMLLTQLSSIQSICWWYWYPLPPYPSVVIWGYSLWKLDQICVPAIWSVHYPDTVYGRLADRKIPFHPFLKENLQALPWFDSKQTMSELLGKDALRAAPHVQQVATCMGGWPCKNGPPSCKGDETTVNPCKPML